MEGNVKMFLVQVTKPAEVLDVLKMLRGQSHRDMTTRRRCFRALCTDTLLLCHYLNRVKREYKDRDEAVPKHMLPGIKYMKRAARYASEHESAYVVLFLLQHMPSTETFLTERLALVHKILRMPIQTWLTKKHWIERWAEISLEPEELSAIFERVKRSREWWAAGALLDLEFSPSSQDFTPEQRHWLETKVYGGSMAAAIEDSFMPEGKGAAQQLLGDPRKKTS